MSRLYISFKQVPLWVRVGVFGALLTYIAVASFTAITLPAHGAADSAHHIDYIYQVSQGEVPDSHGLKFKPIWRGTTFENSPNARNYAASHPPLQYMVGAALVGGLLEDERWRAAVAVMRLFNTMVGAVILLVLAWAGWRLGGALKSYLSVSLPALAVLYLPFMRTAGDVYNEPLVVLFATIALTLTAIALKDGPSRWHLVVLAMVCALGMFTKATFITTLLLVVFFVGVAYFIHRPGRDFIKNNLFKFIQFTGLVTATTVAITGWFYYRNYAASGSWFRSVEKFEVSSRPYKSLIDNLTNPDFYTVVADSIFGMRSLSPILSASKELSLVLFGLLGVGVVYAAVKLTRKIIEAGIRDKRSLILLSIVSLFVLQMLGLYAQQLQHATGWGNINPRYFLTGLLPIGLYMAIGAVYFRAVRPYVTPILMLTMSSVAVIYSVWFTGHREGVSINEQVIQLVAANGLPGFAVYAAYVLVGIGVLAVGVSLHKLNISSKNDL